MNTDNMTVSGETIDYGPCAFMDTYNPDTVFSSIDTFGRYAYKNQPDIGAWNLARFAEALLPLLNEDETLAVKLAQDAVIDFSNLYNTNWYHGMRNKLGLFNEENGDVKLIQDLLTMMKDYKADYTNTFSALTSGELKGMEIFNSDEFKKWYDLWQIRLKSQNKSEDEIKKLMEENNPWIIPRNHRVEEALEAAVYKDDYIVMDGLLRALSRPYDYSTKSDYYSMAPDKAFHEYKTYCGT